MNLRALLLSFFLLPATGLTQVQTGSLDVIVKDPAGQPVSGAELTLDRPSTGFSRSPESAADAVYRFSLLPPQADYRLTLRAPGFADRVVEPLTITLGESFRLEVELSAAAATFSSSAVAVPIAAVDPQRTQLASVLDLSSIDNLPINRRNYLDFALLTPGVAETTVLPEANDFRVKVGNPSDLSFAGSNGRNTIFSIDGLSISAYSGNVRPSLPQVAVQEFQVSRNGYPAEIGFASGGAVNIVSRSGSNNLHGSLFGFLRHRNLQARNFFDPVKSSYTRVQSGASLGGPLRKDRSFFYTAFERLDRHETVFVPLLTDPASLNSVTPSQRNLFNFLDQIESLRPLSQGLRFALTPSNNPLVTPLFRRDSGTFPFDSTLNQGSLRLDHALTPAHALFFRFNITRQRSDNTRFGALDGWSTGSTLEFPDHSLVASDTWTISPQTFAQIRFGYGSVHHLSTPNDPFGPNIQIGGAGNFGRDIFLPNNYRERYYQFHPQFSFHRGRHQLKTGADLNWIPTRASVVSYFGGRFTFGEAIPLGFIVDSASGVPNLSTQLAGILAGAGQAPLIDSLLQPVTSLQSFALGLPLVFQMGQGNSTYNADRRQHAFYVEDSWRPRSNLTLNLGFRYQALQPAWVAARHNFAPRFGLAWTPTRVPRLVLRAAYGLYHDTIVSTMTFSHEQFVRKDLNLILVPITGVPLINPQTKAPVTSVDVWQNLLRKNVIGNRAISAQDLADVGIPPGFQFPISGGMDPNYRAPNSQHAHLAADYSFAGFLTSLSLEASRSRHLFRIIDTNKVAAGRQPNGLPLLAPRNPALVSYFNHETTANAWYWAANLRIERRFRRHFGFTAFYTLSRAMDDSSDYFLDYMPANILDKRAEIAPSLYDQRHRFVFSGVFSSPAKSPWLSNWQLAPILRANSARPFNVLSGIDFGGDGIASNDRPLGLGRNAGRIPGFFTLDLRLARSFRLNERFRLDATAEVFNLPNKTNFTSVNNIVGPTPLSALPRPLRGFAGTPTLPLAFASAADPRQFQLGLKLAF